MTTHNPNIEGDVAAAMRPEWRDGALAVFVAANPHYHGAEWADCLEVLIDGDACLDITEPIWDDRSVHGRNQVIQIDRNDVRPWINAAAVSLHYWLRSDPLRNDPAAWVPRFHAILDLAIAARTIATRVDTLSRAFGAEPVEPV